MLDKHERRHRPSKRTNSGTAKRARFINGQILFEKIRNLQMSRREQGIREYWQRLDPEKFGLNGVKSVTARKLGLGESNLNYLVTVDGRKFMVRINMDPSSPLKSKREYDSLKLVEPLDIAPRALHFEPSRRYLGEAFIILEYLEGTSLDKCGEIDECIVTSLGRVVARLHNTNVENLRGELRKSRSSKLDILREIRKRISYIETRRRKYFEEKNLESILAVPYEKLEKLKFEEEPSYVLGHSDIAPQNVILSEGDLKLVDWEDLGLIDPALEVAIIFDSFDFSDRQKELFLKEYEALRNDAGLRKRISIYWLFQLFDVFCWAIMHAYEIGEREMHEEFLREQDLREHISYVQKMFHKCQREGIIDKKAPWNPSKVFPEKYLRSRVHQ
jgi:thiamine kinase-like enzyme